MADVALLLRSSVSVILVVAGIGKLGAWRSSRSFDRGLGLSELIMGVWLASQLATIVPASLIVVRFVAYAIHSIHTGPADRCQCFGAFFPASGRSMQRMRNIFVLCLAVLNFDFIASSGRAGSSWPVADVGLGTLIAFAIIAMPWAFDWWWDSRQGDLLVAQERRP
ncbi:MAG: MauE/DoxX family redox-associated membrane protein [Candidatus Dormibacteraceae bacterium]